MPQNSLAVYCKILLLLFSPFGGRLRRIERGGREGEWGFKATSQNQREHESRFAWFRKGREGRREKLIRCLNILGGVGSSDQYGRNPRDIETPENWAGCFQFIQFPCFPAYILHPFEHYCTNPFWWPVTGHGNCLLSSVCSSPILSRRKGCLFWNISLGSLALCFTWTDIYSAVIGKLLDSEKKSYLI